MAIERSKKKKNSLASKKVVIIGAGEAGIDVYREIKDNKGLHLEVVGFIDDDPDKKLLKINGSQVLGDKTNLKSIIRKYKIVEAIIAIPSAKGENISEYVRLCSEAKVVFRIVPRVREIIEGKAYLKTLRKVQVEDLLGRPVVKSDVFELKEFFKGKKVLVTGAAGSIGSELVRQISAFRPKELILVDWWENGVFELTQELKRNFPRLKLKAYIANVQDEDKIDRIFENHTPNYVFHAAAYKHVPLMEEHPDEAIKDNILGTKIVAESARKYETEKFVFVSTDKAANPRSVMGATKSIAEKIVKSLNGQKTKYMCVRFGNVLDSNGSVIPIFRKQIENGGPVTITDKRMTRYFMTIPEAAQLILKAASMGEGGELFVLDMGEPVKIVDLAENLIRLSGFIPDKDIKIVYTGVRPGEKLRERLFNKDEKLETTKQEKIYITKSNGLHVQKLDLTVDKLLKFAKKGDNEQIVKLLKKST
ncbi:MAG: nucleoside-diphosphate sugar epimerase/dehydratase [Patescibacteria group bacterium]